MNAKRYRAALSGIIILVIIATMFAIYYFNTNKTLPDEIDADKNIKHEYMYFLKEYNEQIGIFRTDEQTPFSIIDVYVYNLPTVDQSELKAGVLVQDDTKLKTIIEDYES